MGEIMIPSGGWVDLVRLKAYQSMKDFEWNHVLRQNAAIFELAINQEPLAGKAGLVDLGLEHR